MNIIGAVSVAVDQLHNIPLFVQQRVVSDAYFVRMLGCIKDRNRSTIPEQYGELLWKRGSVVYPI